MSPDATTMREVYLSGLVKRHHTNASEATQTIGHHSWGVAMLLLWLAPDVTMAAVRYALRHDVGERVVGDLPAQLKWAQPALAALHGNLEDQELAKLGFDEDLSEREMMAVKCADLLELLLYCNHRLYMGDAYFHEVKMRVHAWFSSHPKYLEAFPKAKELLYVL